MAEFRNQFSWSWSRQQAFETCLRRYWFQHYGFWGGWKGSASPQTRDLYIQKKLLSRAQWVGIQVHEAAEGVLKANRRGEVPAPQQVIDRAMFVAKRQIKESEGRRYLENPKRYPGFLEHYYSHPETKPWEPHTEEIKRQIAGLFENPVFLRLSRVANKICEIEELQQIQVETVPVWVSLDVLVEDGQDGYVIIDWKTGREHQADKVAAQLGVYGVYVHHQYFRHHQADGRPVGGLKAMYVNTRHNTHETFVVDAEMIADAGRLIHQSAKSMLELLADKTENIANKEDFPVIEEGSAACSQCSYRRACGRE